MSRIERHWQGKTALTALLFPISLLFRAAVALRRALFRVGVLRPETLPVPVIVVGNITVGGTGKTPLVLWLAGFLAGHGMRPGIIARGYGSADGTPRRVTAASDAAACGDEALLVAQRCDAPVFVGADRVAAARALLAGHPECDVIVSDDGLQHYRLPRTIEIAVVDGARGLGNGFLLPAGPLREPPGRLASVDAIVVNITQSTGVVVTTGKPPSFAMAFSGSEFYNLLNPGHRTGPAHFAQFAVHAVAGIGNPERFFAHLKRLGLSVTGHPFPDHHAFSAGDLALDGADCILMTEKDAVKCRLFANEKHWVLPIDAEIDPAFGAWVLKKLGKAA